MYKVLIVTFSMGIGGLENIIMGYFRNIDRNKFHIDFLINKNFEESDYIKEIKLSGSNVYYIDTPGKMGPFKYVDELTNIISNNGPYIAVHSNTEYHGGLVCLAAKRAGVANRICHSHTTNVSRKYNQLLMPVYRTLIKMFATKKLACGVEAGNFLFKNNFQILPNAIEVDKYLNVESNNLEKLRDSLEIDKNSTLIGHVGRFSVEKNHVFLIELMVELLKISANIYLILIGDGQLRSEIEQYAKKKKVYQNIKFVGFRNNVNEYLHIMDLILLPSFYEGLPVSIIEGQACGVKCLVSSKVSREVDLNLNLVKFLSINDKKEWIDQIIVAQKIVVEKELIKKTFTEKLYDIKSSVKMLESIYAKKSQEDS
ncbi:glycosyltransferase [Paenibacillus sp. SYP-B4298]|uniref:glycosyltransferase n=1 Tax=Paenibacillus sp. SYP-B4298 TaxID=2996034 RepID=UPI0022DDE292|nr:glycosyltransferase [Paenibacillus sp. SYP-B4298]